MLSHELLFYLVHPWSKCRYRRGKRSWSSVVCICTLWRDIILVCSSHNAELCILYNTDYSHRKDIICDIWHLQRHLNANRSRSLRPLFTTYGPCAFPSDEDIWLDIYAGTEASKRCEIFTVYFTIEICLVLIQSYHIYFTICFINANISTGLSCLYIVQHIFEVRFNKKSGLF